LRPRGSEPTGKFGRGKQGLTFRAGRDRENCPEVEKEAGEGDPLRWKLRFARVSCFDRGAGERRGPKGGRGYY